MQAEVKRKRMQGAPLAPAGASEEELCNACSPVVPSDLPTIAPAEDHLGCALDSGPGPQILASLEKASSMTDEDLGANCGTW